MNAQITGLGWVTPLGRSLAAVWTGIQKGTRPAPSPMAKPIGGSPAECLKVPAGSVDDAAALPRLRRSSAISHFAVAAATDAVADAGLDAAQLARTALVFAASDGGVVYTRRFFSDIIERGEGAGSPLLFPETVYNAPASHIASRLGLENELLTLVGDAATGLAAVRTGCELLQTGDVDHCLVVAAQESDWVTWEAYARWHLIGDQGRERALFSEGAAAVVLSRHGTGCAVARSHPGVSCKSERDASGRLDALLAEMLGETAPALAISGASGTRLDAIELGCLRKRAASAALLHPKLTLGESMACSALQHVVAGTLALRNQMPGPILVTAAGFHRQISALLLTQGGTHG